MYCHCSPEHGFNDGNEAFLDSHSHYLAFVPTFFFNFQNNTRMVWCMLSFEDFNFIEISCHDVFVLNSGAITIRRHSQLLPHVNEYRIWTCSTFPYLYMR